MHLDLLAYYPPIYIGGAILLGLMVGSFLNVVIYRLPIMMEREWQQDCRLLLDREPLAAGAEPFNLAQPRSCCPHCKAPIKAWQNIPVISYLMLRGKCATCRAPISIRYPIIEAVTGLLSGVVAWYFGWSLATLAVLALTWALIALTMIDVDHQLLPDQITLPLLWAGLVLNSFALFVPLQDAVWGAVGGYLSLWTVYWLFKIFTGKEGMGFGDFKLLAALGAWMGWQQLAPIIILSSLVGAVIGSIMLFVSRRGRDTAIPFGPYLATAGWISLLWGDALIKAYLNYSGLQ